MKYKIQIPSTIRLHEGNGRQETKRSINEEHTCDYGNT